ncbi:MAG: hypothetical protein FVQ80_03660 [Planctomycetes bacterium]|nr:hypothetical protein [Planctomycetota bacterium]
MSKKQKIIYIKEIIPDRVKNNSVLNISTKGVTSLTHGFHKYPGKFIPHIPRWAINKYLNGDKGTILDPFCGSGTTLIEGVLAGHNVVGIDIDPLSSLISKVKITPVNLKKLKEIADWLVLSIKKAKKGEFKPECETINHWFTKDAINKLSIIRTSINQIPGKFGNRKSIKDIQDLLVVCFSSIIRHVSNADNESQKTYVSHTKVKNPKEVYSVFFPKLELFIDRITKFTKLINSDVSAKISCTSSNKSLHQKFKVIKFDLVITSPPYIKALDYIYNQMVELFWIGDLFDLQTQSKQNQKKEGYIGTKHLRKAKFKDYTPYKNIFGINRLDEKLQEVFVTDKKNGHKHSFVTFKYFTNMEKHFIEIAKCICKGTPYIMVVGNSTVSNIYFDTVDFLIQIAEQSGFKARNKWGYEIKNRYMRFDRKGRGGIIDIDWVIDFVRK